MPECQSSSAGVRGKPDNPGRRMKTLSLQIHCLGHRLCRAAVILLLALVHLAPQARSTLDLEVARQPVPLRDWGDYWLDKSGRLTAAEVDADRTLAWQPTVDGKVYPSADGQALWIRFTVPPAPDRERWYLEIAYPSLNSVSLFTLDAAGQWMEQRAGDKVPVAEWPVPQRHPLMPVVISAEEPQRYLMRIEHPHHFGPPLQFVSESHHYRSEARISLLLGTFFGLLGLAILVSLTSAVYLRDAAYGWFATHSIFMGLMQAALTGVGGLHLWPRNAWWNDAAPFVLAMLMLGSLTMLVAALVTLSERSHRLHRSLQGLGLVSVVLAASVTLMDSPTRMAVYAGWILLCTLSCVGTLVWAWRRGDRFAGWLLACGLPLVVGSAPAVARMLGWLPVSFSTLHGLQVGIAVQLPFVLLVLMLRSADRRENRRRLSGMDRTDPATGLITAHVFEERLARMAARSQRLSYQSALLLIDIGNLEQIQRDFDRSAGEELPLRMAARLLAATREIDSVARLSDRRFGMLIEGPVSPEEAQQAAPRLIARGLMPFKDKPIEWVAQLRVAQALVPLDDSDSPRLLERLGALLDGVPADTRSGIFTLRG